MIKKFFAGFVIFLILCSYNLYSTDIIGKVINSTTGKPYTKGNILLLPFGEEKYIKAEIDERGNFIYRDLKPGKYIIKMDLYGLTPIEKEIRVPEGQLNITLPITLSFLDKTLVFIRELSDFMWGSWMLILLLGTGILLTFLTRFIQVRRLLLSLKMVLRGAAGKEKYEKEEGDISPYAALMTALAATVGNGNIAGVATAIATGGPGAPVWMWIAGFFGMATKYAEGFLGVKFRIKNPRGEMSGGPMYYARFGIKTQSLAKFMGALFATCGGIAALFGTGNMAQSNSMALAFNDQFGVPFWITGLVITTFVGMVILGGIKRIGLVSERLVPTMILFYFGGAIVVILANITYIPEAFAVIFKSAFTTKAVGGALVGTSVKQAISIGIRRGLLSNESGLGSAAIAQSASRSADPSMNGLIAMTGTFIDTLVVNTLTTLTIVLSGAYLKTAAFGATEGLTSTALTAEAFESIIPYGGYIIAFSSLLFGYSTLLGWCYYGEKCLEYFLGVRVIYPYRIAFIILLFIGAIVQGVHLNIIWYIGDTANALMAFPNLLALLFLSGLVGRTTIKYFYKK
ncbi:amino acid carrier protein [Candidatus Aminicenantes bacterium AH-873-B07]|jgi:AGCS family alanine or glycine:cation symporter|nr:amino acid carrier protein [Candidatus Aminicenantes bacterium AH-873-B07]